MYQKHEIIYHLLILFGEYVTMTTVYEFVAGFIKQRILAAVLIRFLLILQILHFSISMYELIYNYGLLMRIAADIPTAYYVLPQPFMFDSRLLPEGMPKIDVYVEFMIHCFEAQKVQSICMFIWILVVVILHLMKIIEYIK